MADSRHRPSIYPPLIHFKKTGSGEIACSFHSLRGYRVCDGYSGKPFGYRCKRAGRRGRNESAKLKGNIEKMTSRITLAGFSSLNIKFLGEFRHSRSISVFTQRRRRLRQFLIGSFNSVASPGRFLRGKGSQEFLEPPPPIQCCALPPSAGHLCCFCYCSLRELQSWWKMRALASERAHVLVRKSLYN